MSKMQSTRSLRSRIIGASAWVIFGHTFSQVLRLGSNLIMTRLLVPEMFGLMALANVFYLGLALFSDFGLRQNIIRSHRGDDPVFLNTVWTMQVIRGGIIWAMALGLAVAINLMNSAQIWPASSVYTEPLLPYLVVVLAFNAVIKGFSSTNLATAHRNMLFGIVTRIELLSQFTGVMLMIAWALFDRSIWALAAGSLLSSTVHMALSHMVVPGLKNKFDWDSESFHEVFHFGKWIFLSSILGFMAINGDRFILGSLVDSTVLGFYAIAILIVKTVEMVITKIIRSVAFPAISEIVRDRPAELSRVYYKFRLPVDAISLFAAGLLFMTGEFVIEVLYDDRYLQTGYMLEILSLSLLMVRYGLATQCFVAIGKPGLLVPIVTVRLIVVYLVVPIVYSQYGLEIALWVIAGSRLATLPVILYLKVKNNIMNITHECVAILFLAGGVMCGWVVRQLFIAS